MRLLGVIGGMSWLSTIEYYRLLNEGIQKAVGGSHSARLVLSSVDFQGISDAISREDWPTVKGVLEAEARRLAGAGAGAASFGVDVGAEAMAVSWFTNLAV